MLGVTPTESGAKRFNTIVHWAYGTGWGAVRGLLGGVGLSGPAATLALFAAVWGAEHRAASAGSEQANLEIRRDRRCYRRLAPRRVRHRDRADLQLASAALAPNAAHLGSDTGALWGSVPINQPRIVGVMGA